MSAIVSKRARKPKRFKAGLATAGAAALLIGGGSTFALWSDTAEIAGTFDNDTDLTAGHWELNIALDTDEIEWFDASPDAVAYAWSGGDLTDASTGWLGFPQYTPKTNEWKGTVQSTGYSAGTVTVPGSYGNYVVNPTTGYPIDPAGEFRVVPGDVIVGLFTMEDLAGAGVDVTNLVGQNLAVQLGTPDISGAEGEATVTGDLAGVLQATAVAIDTENMAIVVVYPSEATDYLGENSKTGTVGASLSGLTATITQVRPGAISAS